MKIQEIGTDHLGLVFFYLLFYSTIYPTPPSILPLVTWVPQSKLAFAHHCRVSWPWAFGPSPTTILTHHSLACRWRLQESFLIETHRLCLIVRPYADNYELSYTTTLSYITDTILPGLG